MARGSRFPPRIGENILRWDRQLRSLSRSIARDFTRGRAVGPTGRIESPETEHIQETLSRSLARAFDGLPAGYSFLGVLDDLAERLRLDSLQLLSFVGEGERSLARDETRPGFRRPGPRLPAGLDQKGPET